MTASVTKLQTREELEAELSRKNRELCFRQHAEHARDLLIELAKTERVLGLLALDAMRETAGDDARDLGLMARRHTGRAALMTGWALEKEEL